jgi:hypothetical protein
MYCSNRSVAAVAVFACAAPFVAAGDDFADLIRRLPASANTVAVINVKAIRESTGARDVSQVAGMTFPSTIDMAIYATHLEPSTLETRSTCGLARLNRKQTLKEMATQSNGEVVNVGEMTIVDFGRRGRAFLLADNLVGFGRGINHQDLFRWKQFADSNQRSALPNYLTEALSAAPDAAIFVALDMEHMVELRSTCERVSQAKAAEGFSKGRIEGCSTLLTGLRGITFTVSQKDPGWSEVRLDFAGDVGRDGTMVKAMFLEALDDLGAMIEDFQYAKVTMAPHTVTLGVRLSENSLMRIMSVFAPPPAPTPPLPAAPHLEANGVDLNATRQYFKHIDRLLDDLDRTTRNSSNYLRSATWHETYANRIEDLNPHYVDADVVKYSQTLMAKLRTLAWSLRGVVVEVGALDRGMTDIAHGITSPMPSWRYMPRWFGGNGGVGLQVDTNVSQLRTQQAEIIRQDASRRTKIWESINEDRRTMLKTVQERYGVSLDKPAK